MNKINFILMEISIVFSLRITHGMYEARSPLPSERTVKVISQAHIPQAIEQLSYQRKQEEKQQEQRVQRRQRYEGPQWDANPFYSPAQGIRSDAEHAQDPDKFEQYTDPLG